MQFLKRYPRDRIEIRGVHITQDGGIKLTSFGILRSLVKIRHDNEQSAFPDGEFKGKPEFMITLDVVDYLNYRPIGG